MPFVPLQWLGEVVDVDPGSTAEDVAAALVKVGLEEEGVHGSGVMGPLVVGRVITAEKETHKNGKSILYCRVDVGEHNDPEGEFPASRGIVCGAHNFGAGDLVAVALPGAVLPGDFEIAARKTYGHVSDGMICSERELRIGDDHSGIMVLTRKGFEAADLTPGQDALPLLGLDEETLEITVTPDRGYCFCMRGVAREYSHSTGNKYRDPALAVTVAPATKNGFPLEVDDKAPIRGRVGCDRFVARYVRGVDAAAPSPAWMQKRLMQSGMRPISLAVDVTNYVMLELGQPLHAYDAAKVDGPIVVRRAAKGEKLTTLDDVERELHPEDLLITDSPGGKKGSRILALAGVMGGASSEVSETTTDLLIEGAHFDPVTVARTARRHKLPSESSKRFERGVDPEMAPVAVQRVIDLLVEYGGGVDSTPTADPEVTDLDNAAEPVAISMPTEFPDRIVGVEYAPGEVRATLEAIGCGVMEKGERLVVVPPSWRPDLKAPIDLVEEVARLHGYDELPSVLPVAPPGRGLSHSQKVRRAVARALAERGLTEVQTYPFISASRLDDMLVPEADWRRSLVCLANPLDEGKPFLRTAVLETIFDAVAVNLSRGIPDLAIFEVGRAYLNEGTGVAQSPDVTKRPSDEEVAELDAALPHQPRHVVGILAGNRQRASWNAPAVPFDWTDAVAAAHEVARAAGVEFDVSPGETMPFHPGRTARLTLNRGPENPAQPIAFAGELHPKVIENLGLPPRTCAFAIHLDPIIEASEGLVVKAVPVRTPPLAKEDFAFVVDEALAAGDLVATVREAAGELLEEARVFDVYAGEQVGAGKKSIALTVTLRAADHTLTAEEILAVRNAIIAAAEKTHGAKLR
ncbi:MAG: phenylalanine--tRNA ligase subunit beta [Demequinaceae bacterium]|nr:phenylalanine--tRNA ligase subunit beta [Demequinaceae bacterium]